MNFNYSTDEESGMTQRRVEALKKAAADAAAARAAAAAAAQGDGLRPPPQRCVSPEMIDCT